MIQAKLNSEIERLLRAAPCPLGARIMQGTPDEKGHCPATILTKGDETMKARAFFFAALGILSVIGLIITVF